MITRAALLAAALRLLGYYNGNDYSAGNPGGMSGVGGMATNWEPCIQDIGTVANGVGEVAGTIAAAQSTIGMVWDAATTVADPGAGKLHAATATPAVGSYSLLVSATDSAGTDVGAMLSELGASSSATKARARLVAVGDASKYLDLLVTGISGAGAFRTLAVTCIGGPGGFAAGDAVALGWVRTGDKGDIGSGVTAATPNTLAQRDAAGAVSVTGLKAPGGASDSLAVTAGVTEQISDANWNYAQSNLRRRQSNASSVKMQALMLGGDDTANTSMGAYWASWLVCSAAPGNGSTSGIVNKLVWAGPGDLDLRPAGKLLVKGVEIGSGEDTATSIAVASSVDIGSTTAKAIKITAGTGPITAWGTAPAGAHRDITFATAVVLTQNATSAILTGGGNITTAVGDTCRMESLGGGNWKMLSYQRANGLPLGIISTQALSMSDKSSNVSLTDSNMTANNIGGSVGSGRAVAAIDVPRYWEVVVLAMTSPSIPGIAAGSAPVTDYLTNSTLGWGYLASGYKGNNGQGQQFGDSWGAGSRLCFAYNPANRGFWMGKVVNNVPVWGGGGDPEAGTNPAYTIPANTPVFPGYSIVGQGTAFNHCFGSGQQAGSAPSGYFAFT